MPRDGSNVYHRPPGTDGVPNTTIASAPYNVWVADIEQDLNLPRPIVAGGTGATNPDAALLAIGAEKASQVVTNYDAQTWMAGSFYSASTATGAPVDGHAFAGFAYKDDSGDWVLDVRDMTDTTHPTYTRIQSAGVWSAWTDADPQYVKKAGDTMTGALNNNAYIAVGAAAAALPGIAAGT